MSAFENKFDKLAEWLSGDRHPTMKQLERFAKHAHVPFGYLFLPNPPSDALTVPEFRTLRDEGVSEMSLELVDTLHSMQLRQEWMRNYLVALGHDRLPYVGSIRPRRSQAAVVDAANAIRQTLGFDEAWAKNERSLADALRVFRDRIEEVGVLVSFNSIVGYQTNRPQRPPLGSATITSDSAHSTTPTSTPTPVARTWHTP